MNSSRKNSQLIKSIGYMWHRKYVDWNASGKALIGYPEHDSNGEPEDFTYQAGIYVLYNPQVEPIYIGQAGSGENTGLFHRLKTHVNDDYLFCLWERFTWFGFYSTSDLKKDDVDKWKFEFTTDVNDLMNAVEAMLILSTRPRDNYSRGNLDGVEWYYQKEEFEEKQA